MGASQQVNVGLILEGGGMRAGFVAGAIMALSDHGVTGFDAALAVSASAPTLAYFVAGQRFEIEKVWREELNTAKLVQYRNIPAASLALSVKRPVLDIDYLLNDVFKGKYPLDMNRLLASQTTCRFAVTLALEGRLAFLAPDEADIYHVFKAAMALPGAYPATVCIGECEYVDGGTVNPLPAGWLFNQGTEKVLAILSKPLDCDHEPPNFLERTILWRYLKRYDWMVEKLWEAAHTYNEEVTLLEELARSKPPRSLLISPETMPPAGFITRDGRKINRTIDMGYRTAEDRMKDIKAFVEGKTV